MVRSILSGCGMGPKSLFAAFIFQVPVKFGFAQAYPATESESAAAKINRLLLVK